MWLEYTKHIILWGIIKDTAISTNITGKRCEEERRTVRYNIDRFIGNIARQKRKSLIYDVQRSKRIGTRRRNGRGTRFAAQIFFGYRWNKNLDRQGWFGTRCHSRLGLSTDAIRNAFRKCNSIISHHTFSRL